MSREAALASIPQQVVTDPQVVAEAVVPPAVNPDAARFEQLAKKEAAIVKEREAIKREREEFEAKVQAKKDRLEMLEAFESKRGSNPVDAIKSLGFTDTEVYNFLASKDAEKNDPVNQAKLAAQAEIAVFKEQQTAEQKRAQAEQNKTIINQFKQNISKEVKSDPEKYEYINHEGASAEALIYSTVEKVLELEGEMISIKEAMDLVENYYEEKDKAMSAIKKRTPKEAVADAKEKIADLKETQSKQQTKTLSNKIASQVSTTSKKQESASEKRTRLMNILRNGA